MGKNIYYEKCNNLSMPDYPFFIDKMEQIEKLSIKITSKKLASRIKSLYSGQSSITFYRLSNIIWDDKLIDKIKNNQSYPSEYFIMVMINLVIINDYIVNPPIKLLKEDISSFMYIPVEYNKLLIIDALFYQGSYPRYQYSNQDKYIYSEHSGVITIKNHKIKNIIVSTETNRIDPNDQEIFLPHNMPLLAQHEFLFHTHPNMQQYAGRIKHGVIYEFPSINDVLNFIKYYNEGIAQASIIISPEGIYVIRPKSYQQINKIPRYLLDELFDNMRMIETDAIKNLKNVRHKLSEPDVFHKYVSYNFDYIKEYNKMMSRFNIFVEFYPRQKKNGEWQLRPFSLAYCDV